LGLNHHLLISMNCLKPVRLKNVMPPAQTWVLACLSKCRMTTLNDLTIAFHPRCLWAREQLSNNKINLTSSRRRALVQQPCNSKDRMGLLIFHLNKLSNSKPLITSLRQTKALRISLSTVYHSLVVLCTLKITLWVAHQDQAARVELKQKAVPMNTKFLLEHCSARTINNCSFTNDRTFKRCEPIYRSVQN
jgi:hypothetical protein